MPIEEHPAVAGVVQIDETGRDDSPAAVDRLPRLSPRQPPDRHDSIARNRHVGRHTRRAAAIDDGAAGKNNVVQGKCLAITARRPLRAAGCFNRVLASTKRFSDRHIFTNRGKGGQSAVHKVCALKQPRQLSEVALRWRMVWTILTVSLAALPCAIVRAGSEETSMTRLGRDLFWHLLALVIVVAGLSVLAPVAWWNVQ